MSNQNPSALDEELLDEEFSILQETRLVAETAQVMLQKLVLRGGDSLSEEARRLMRLFVTQVLTDKENISDALLYWVALSLGNYLTNKENTLDLAFGLTKRGRPSILTPNKKWEMCMAYTEGLRTGSRRLGTGDETLSARIKIAEHSAYAVLYNVRPSDSKDDKGSIDDGLTRVRKVLKEYGFYMAPN